MTNTLRYLLPLALFVGLGTIRVIIKFANFSRWQNLGFKLFFFIGAICYFIIGFYIMYTDSKLTGGMNSVKDAAYKDFTLLYVFSGMALFKECCKLHNRFDSTDKL
jgi:hypothetical protein